MTRTLDMVSEGENTPMANTAAEMKAATIRVKTQATTCLPNSLRDEERPGTCAQDGCHLKRPGYTATLHRHVPHVCPPYVPT